MRVISLNYTGFIYNVGVKGKILMIHTLQM